MLDQNIEQTELFKNNYLISLEITKYFVLLSLEVHNLCSLPTATIRSRYSLSTSELNVSYHDINASKHSKEDLHLLRKRREPLQRREKMIIFGLSMAF
jgi:hypothetical protein